MGDKLQKTLANQILDSVDQLRKEINLPRKFRQFRIRPSEVRSFFLYGIEINFQKIKEYYPDYSPENFDIIILDDNNIPRQIVFWRRYLQVN